MQCDGPKAGRHRRRGDDAGGPPGFSFGLSFCPFAKYDET